MTGLPPAVERDRFLVGTNQKMTKTLGEARTFVDHLLRLGVPEQVQAFVLPSHTALAAVQARLPQQTTVLLGAQDAHWSDEPGHSGEVSMRQVRDAGASLVMLGHAERRSAGETDADVARKAAAAVAHGLVPLVCVGEPLDARSAGTAADVVLGQVEAALSGLDLTALPTVWFAYEPLWAIGEAGAAADPEAVAAMVGVVRRRLGGLGLDQDRTPVLYGGSVDAASIADLARVPDLAGLFVGRAAWRAHDFAALLVDVARARSTSPQPCRV